MEIARFQENSELEVILRATAATGRDPVQSRLCPGQVVSSKPGVAVVRKCGGEQTTAFAPRLRDRARRHFA